MGGKNKQRTKGNVRPSSSGRAADLLAKERGTVPGFIGFGTSSSDLGYVPAIQGAEEIDSLVDADFRMVLRKLSKRDVITKLKAMQEFGTMCKERETEIVKGVLPYWPRIYCKISIDHDRRVREATQQAFEQLILKVKKHLAPHLRSLMGYWLIAQCDTYSPAASAAKVAFEKAFPPGKQPEALIFCKDEILMVLQDHLLKETPDTLSDPQTVPEEEREAKFYRILTCSLLALKKLLGMLPSDENSSLEEKLKLLLTQNKFWKYGKHNAPQVRSAFFELISAFCQHIPESMKGEASRVCPAVLLDIDDSDATVCPALWEAVLHVLTTIEDCWSHVNAKKGVLPKLWTVLQEGGRGLATVIYPNILPFISKVPPGITEPKLDYCRTFFCSVIKGLLTERAMASRSECSAIISAFMECLQFTVLQSIGEEEEEIKIQEMLINDQLVPLIDTVMKESRLQNGPLFFEVADVLCFWKTRAEISGGDGTALTFQRILSNFWDGLSNVCVGHTDVIDANEKSLAAVSSLLQVLQNPENKMKPNKRKAVKIRFAEDAEAESNSEHENCVMRSINDPGTLIHGQHLQKEPLEDLVCKLAELSIVYTNEQRSDRHLKFLSALLSNFASSRVFQVLLQDRTNIQEVAKLHNENPSIQFLYTNLIDWLKEDWRKETDFLVDILYSVLHCCSSATEREDILNDLTKMDLKWNILLEIIEKACSSSEKHSLCSTWLKGDVLGEKLVTLADDLCNTSLKTTVASAESFHSERWTLLSLVLSQLIKNESLIGEIYVKRIIDKLQAALSKAKDLSEAGNTETSVSFICDIASNFFSSVKGCLLMPSSEDLLLTIFQLCAQSQDTTHLSDFLVNKLKHTWLCGLNSLVHHLSDMHKDSTFLQRSALWVKNQLQSSTLDVKSLQVLISAVNDLLTKLLEADEVSTYVLQDYIQWLTPSGSEWDKMRESLSNEWLKKPLLEGRLSMNCEISGTDRKLCGMGKLPSHLCTAALLSRMALLILEKGLVFENHEEEASKTENIIAEQLYALQWIEELANPSCLLLEFLHHSQVMNISCEKLCTLSNITCLLQILFNRSKENGRLWALTMAKLIHSENIASSEVKALFSTTERFFPLMEGNLHTLQNLSPFLLQEDKEELVLQCTAKLMTCNETELYNTDGAFGYLAILNSCLNCGSIDYAELMPGILKIIISWRNEYEDSFLFSCNLQEGNPQVLGFNIEIIRFVSLLLNEPSSLLESEWDFIMCSMLAWLETTSESQAVFPFALVQVFACVSCDLSTALSAYFQAATPEITEKLPVNLMTEWQEFCSEGIHSLLLPLLVKITSKSTANGKEKDALETSFQNFMLKSLGKALMYISKDQLLNHKLPAKFVAGQKTNLPDKLQTLLNTFSPLLLFRARPVQITVYHMLNKLMSDLPQFDNEDLKSYGDEDEELSLSPPAGLMTLLATQEELLENILECIPVGEFTVIQPLSDEFCLVLGYLLIWKLILTFFKAASSQLRALYSQYLRRTKSLNKLLYHLFRLMPENPTFPGSTAELPNKDAKTFFTEELDLDIKDTPALSSHIPHLACSVYCMTLKDLPAMVRLWWNSCEKRVFNIVDKFTTKYVSSVLSSQEISSVQTSTQLFNGMMVKARSATREVIATYSVDDIFIELIIQLPPNYPLGSIIVESGKRVGVAVQQWRNWMLQLSTYLTHQNGSIMEGLALWKNNVDKRFEGVEDCMICFSVIHGSNYSLPKKACRTCKKKFHSACLYKWFTSSNKSTCPLCRETFF